MIVPNIKYIGSWDLEKEKKKKAERVVVPFYDGTDHGLAAFAFRIALRLLSA